MLTFYQTLILVADGSRTQQVIQSFRSAKNDEAMNGTWLSLMVAAGGLAVLTLLAMLVRGHWRRRMSSSPRGLFNELCRAQRLKWAHRRLLWRLAQSQNLTDPAMLFLTPECFTIGRLTAEMRPHAEILSKICGRIFAENRVQAKSEQAGSLSIFRDEKTPTAAFPASALPPTIELPQWNTNIETGVME
jgi:hypothetical protein